MDARTITLKLNGKWYGRTIANGAYGMAFCPAHDNTKTEALCLRYGDDGKILLKCHAGCEYIDIINALKANGIMSGNDIMRRPPASKSEILEKKNKEN